MLLKSSNGLRFTHTTLANLVMLADLGPQLECCSGGNFMVNFLRSMSLPLAFALISPMDSEARLPFE